MRTFRSIVASTFIFLATITPGWAQAHVEFQFPDHLREILGEYRACIMVKNLESGNTALIGLVQCTTQFAPNSTFKVPHALIGLELGVIESEQMVIPWDGSDLPIDVWEGDHTLASALNYSVVPYFREVARRIGQEHMQSNLDNFSYGNRTIGDRIDNFWLDGSLRISPAEQMEFLEALYTNSLPASTEHHDLIRSLIVREHRPGRTLSGKTGSGWDGQAYTQGWFIGHLQNGDTSYIFTIHIQGGDEPTGRRAQALITEILEEMGLY